MKIIHKKNKIVIQLIPYFNINFKTILITYCAIAIFLTAIFPSLFLPFLIFGLVFTDIKNNIVLDPKVQKIEISRHGIKFKGEGKNIKSYDRKDIKRLYIQQVNDELNFYVNYNEKVSFHI